MVKLTSAEIREKQNRRLKAALPDIRKGIERVTEAPGKKAAEKQEKMKQHLVESIDDGTWAKRVSGVSLEEWKDKAANKGVDRISAGIDAAGDKVEKFFDVAIPHIESGQTKVKAMPDLTLEDNIARSAEMQRHMAKLKYKKK